eukprot:2336458-Rhodomonas_salina.2
MDDDEGNSATVDNHTVDNGGCVMVEMRCRRLRPRRPPPCLSTTTQATFWQASARRSGTSRMSLRTWSDDCV